MRLASKIVTSLGSIVILGAGWGAGVAGTTAVTTTTTASGTGSTGTAPSGTGSAGTDSTGATTPSTSAAPSTSTPATTGASDGTYTGDDVNTRFGSVQVQVVVSGGQVTDVVALQLTDAERRSVQISARAEPILRSEVLASQSADISNVSGATYTSDAYIQSLQSALDQAGL